MEDEGRQAGGVKENISETDPDGGYFSRIPLFLNRRKPLLGSHLGRPSPLRGGSGAEKSVSTP
jgi:hypothetical protein